MIKKDQAIHTIKLECHLPHTDAADRIFYPRLFEMCQEAFEKIFSTTILGKPYQWIFKDKNFPVIVHCEADYLDTIKLNDELWVRLSCSHLGRTSFHLSYTFTGLDEKIKSTAKTVYVFTRAGKSKVEIPKNWREVLTDLSNS